MGHYQTTYKKSDHRYQGRQLHIRKAADGMAGSTSPGITGAKSYQHTSNKQY